MMWHDKYIGLPYKSLGRDTKGIDCYGLVYLIYKNELGISLPKMDLGYLNGLDTREVAPVFHDGLELFIKSGFVKEVNGFKPFDLLLFERNGYLSHIGTCISKDKFLHADLGSASCIERVKHRYWKNRLKGVYRYVN